MDSKPKYQRNGDLPFQDLDGELIVVNPGEWKHHLIEGVGLFLWTCLATPQSQANLVDAVCNEFEVSQEQAQSDIENFLPQLLEQGLIAAV